MTCIIAVCVSLVLIIFQLCYNTLLTNLRLFAKMKCVTFGLCLFDCTNWMICFCCVRRLCQDRLNSWFTLVKWIFYIAIIGFTIHQIQEKQQRWEDEFQFPERVVGETRLDSYLIIFLIHIPVLVVARFPLFAIFSILMCCCDKGEVVIEEDTEIMSLIWHYDFVDYELGVLNNFVNHPVGRAEVTYNRNLEYVR